MGFFKIECDTAIQIAGLILNKITKLLKMLTVIIPSFHSSKQIEQRILEINKKEIRVIIIENSKNIELKKKIENKYKNVKIMYLDENLGC